MKKKAATPLARMTSAETDAGNAGAERDPLETVFSLIISGASEFQVRKGLDSLFPDKEAGPLIVAVMKRIAEEGGAVADTVHGWCIEATRHVYQKALLSGDFATALRAVKQLHDLAGGQSE